VEISQFNNIQSHQDTINFRQIIVGIIIVFLAAICAIVSSKLGLGLLAVWPVIVLIIGFINRYELGLICFALSFAYQAPVVFVPEIGLSAVIRLDELIFAAVFLVYLLRGSIQKDRAPNEAPLRKPLLLYVILAFLSLIVRYDDISSTPFFQSGTGLKGLGPLIFKLAEVVGGYFILTDQHISQKTRRTMFLCLPIVAGFAVILSFLIAHGIIPKDIFGRGFYDPNEWYTRFSLYGNTSAWGVLLVIYFFIFLNSVLNFRKIWIKLILILLLVLCVDAIFISGTKTAMVGIIIGLIFLMIREYRNFSRYIKIVMLSLIIIIMGSWSINEFGTESQKKTMYGEVENAYIGSGAKGFGPAYHETSLGSRIDHWFRFGDAVNEEPALLVLGRGWQRRGVYITGESLHNDVLTAIHDLGIGGGFFVIWLYWVMFRQFQKKMTNKIINKSEREDLLISIMFSIILAILISSFTSENLTLYFGIDVQFPFITVIMAITWNYLRGFNYRMT